MAKAEKKDQIFFIGIRDPIEIRRSLLESSKDIVHSLQRFERFKEVRKEKLEALQEVRKTMSHVKKLMADLKKALPETDLRVELGKEEQRRKLKKAAKETKKEVKVAKPMPIKERISPKEMNELEKLESELSAIEGKLSRLV
ncbi:hypothetical protein KY328_00785 [Candidatus Woesearchaeota archaeon]|nr:hypothetical protein [Candidatus Woesearchaeota archaeon]MBW3021432.1 hypothetical protein [Candidatus Woesearchaeota archaeon]